MKSGGTRKISGGTAKARRGRGAEGILIAFMVMAGNVFADDLIWNLTSDGNWDTSSLNWTNTTSGGIDSFTDGGVDDVTFNKLIQVTIAIDPNMTPNSITVNANSGTSFTPTYVFTGGPIDGAITITKQFNSTLSLLSSNSYSGETILQGGTLFIGDDNALGTSTLRLQGGVFSSTGAVRTIANDVFIEGNVSLSGASGAGTPATTFDGTVTLTGDRTITLGTGGGVTTFNNGITQTGGLGGTPAELTINAVQPRTIELLGTSTYTGRTILGHRVTLHLAGENATEGITVGAGAATPAAKLLIDYDNALGTGKLILNGSATIEAATVSRTITNDVDFNGPTFIVGGASPFLSLTMSGAVTLNTNLTISATDPLTFSGTLTENGGPRSLTLTTAAGGGSRTYTFSGTSDYSGGTVVEGAILKLEANNALPINGALTVNGINPTQFGRLDLNGFDLTIGSLSGNATQNAVFLDANTLTTGGDDTDTSYDGVMSGAGGNLVKVGTGTFTLNGANTYSGTTTISNGVLRIGASDRLADASAVTVAGGSFDIDTFNEKVDTITLTGGAITGTSGVLTGSVYNLQSGAVSANLGGTAPLNKSSSGTVILPGANSYEGVTAISNGALRVNANAANVSTNVIQLRGGVLETSGTFSRGLAASGPNALNWGAGGGGFSAFGGPLTVNIGSGATLTWNSANFVPDGSPLIFGSSGANDEVIVANAIDLGSSGTNIREIRVEDNAGSSADRAVITNVISGSAGNDLAKTGPGVLEFASANTYSGNTTVSGGTLLVNNNTGSGTGSGSVTVNSGGTLGGSGIISGSVAVDDGGALSPGNSPDTLTVGSLTLSDASELNYELGPHNPDGSAIVGGGTNDLTIVDGDLVLDGLLNVSALDGFYSFGAGLAGTNVYRLFEYTGVLTDNSLSVNSMPAGTVGFIEIDSLNQQVNLLVIPEPSVVVLLGTGLAAWVVRRRRNAGA